MIFLENRFTLFRIMPSWTHEFGMSAFRGGKADARLRARLVTQTGSHNSVRKTKAAEAALIYTVQVCQATLPGDFKGGVPSLITPLIWLRSSGVSWCR